MRFEDLLEKKEAKKIRVLKQLLLAGGSITITDMVTSLSVSKKSVENYLEELMDDLKPYQDKCQLSYDKTMIYYSKTSEFSMWEVEKTWYDKAPKFQILLHLLRNREIAFIRLTQELAVSESSLSRKIKELNQLLKEFDLMIWQGKLEGEESQIRYFYFQLLWYLEKYPKEIVGRELDLLEQLERGFGVSIKHEARYRTALWMRITKYRIALYKPQFTKFREKFEPYQRDRFYLQIKPIFHRLFSYYAVELKEEEIMLHFIFLISMSILNEKDFYQYWLQRSKFTPTSLTDTLVLETIMRLYPRAKIRPNREINSYYHLSQVHLRLYFFKGDIEVYDRENIWQLEKTLSSRDIQTLSDQLIHMSLESLAVSYTEENSLIAMTEVKYLSLLTILDVEMNREIRVGIDLQMDPLFKEAATIMYMLHLKNLNGVVIEPYQSEKSYDLIITNHQSYDSCYYRLSELGTSYDIQEIKKIIREL